MPYRDMLVHLHPDGQGPADRPQLPVALGLAASHQARLTGLLTLRDVALLKLLYPADSPLVVEREAQARRQADRLRADFLDMARTAGVEAAFEIGEGDAAELLGLAGRYHDLVVVRQADPLADEGFDVPTHCLAAAGRPVLVVPRGGPAGASIARHVLIAWNETRESSLAVQLALPLIAGAHRVTVLLGRSKQNHPGITRRPPLDIARHLQRFADVVEGMEFDPGEAEAGAAILSAAAEFGADMVVMGAYGRSWLREWVMGGATRHVLRHADRPVLMAH